MEKFLINKTRSKNMPKIISFIEWSIKNAEEMHEKYPDTFNIPTLSERENLLKGDFAKLIFLFHYKNENDEVEILGERMWVVVNKVNRHAYHGILNNQPAFEYCISVGDLVHFMPRNIIDILKK